jgi:hypothetical protein
MADVLVDLHVFVGGGANFCGGGEEMTVGDENAF